MNNEFPVSRLLARIGLDALPKADRQGLATLVDAFRQAIPFENFDTLAGIPVSCKLADIVDKILVNGRGGWCHELNQLFAETLRVAGFDVAYRLARVGYRRPSFGPLTHLVMVVTLDAEQWLVDVGFGGPGPTEPMPLASEGFTGRQGERFRIDHEAVGSITLHRLIEGDWVPLYQIQTINVLPVDIEMACHFTATSPLSPFRRIFMCAACDGEFTWTLEGDELLHRGAQWQVISRVRIEDARHLQTIIEANFCIRVPMAVVEQSWVQVTT